MEQHSGLFRPETRPVVLPSDPGPRPSRHLVAWIAVLIVVGGVVAGVLYRDQRHDAGSDITRLLPASTALFVHVAQPWARLQSARLLERWEDPEALEASSEARGLLADGLGGRPAEVPQPLLRTLLLATDTLRVAMLRTPEGDALLLFLEVGDEWTRRRVLSGLAPHLRTVDRSLGYAIQVFDPPPGWAPWHLRGAPLGLVVMDDQLVVSLGPPGALEDLVEARVTGRSQPIARREGFDVAAAHDPGAALWSFVDPALAADGLARLLGDAVADPARFRVALVDAVRSVTVSSAPDHGTETLLVGVGLQDREEPADLARALAAGPRTLAPRLAPRASALVGLAFAEPAAAGRALAVAAPRLLVDLGLGAPLERLAARVQVVDRVLRDLGAASAAAAFTGEVVLAWPAPTAERPVPGPWIAALGVRDAALAEAAAGPLARALGGPDLAYGTLYGDGPPLHVAVPASEAPAHAPSAVWQVRDGFAVVAPDADTLAAGVAWLAAPPPVGREALRGLHPAAPLVLMAQPSLLADRLPPWLAGAVAPLRPGFRAVASARVLAEGGLVVQSNVGLWTGLVALLATDRLTVEGALLADLPGACVARWQGLCRDQPAHPLCAPFDPTRRPLLEAACGTRAR